MTFCDRWDSAHCTSHSFLWLCSKWNASCALAVLWTNSGHRVRVSVKSMRPYCVPIVILAFRRVLASGHFVAAMCPWSALLPGPHWGELRSRLLPDRQGGITSRKCRLRGRPQGFIRVPFGTGPMVSVNGNWVWYNSDKNSMTSRL